MFYQGTLYHCHTLASELEEVVLFVVPTAHPVAAMNGCHWDAGHQGQKQMLCLLQDQFWWHGMATQMQKAISNCEWSIQHEGTHGKAPMEPIIAHHSFWAVTHRLHEHWDDYGVGSTTKHGEHSGFLQLLYKTHHGLHDPHPNWRDCC